MKFFEYLENIKTISTKHLTGVKQVFLSNEDTESALTQFAYGVLKPGERTELHKHDSMVECFYFISGTGEYHIDDSIIEVKADTFVHIPYGINHDLANIGNEELRFVYFGIAV